MTTLYTYCELLSCCSSEWFLSFLNFLTNGRRIFSLFSQSPFRPSTVDLPFLFRRPREDWLPGDHPRELSPRPRRPPLHLARRPEPLLRTLQLRLATRAQHRPNRPHRPRQHGRHPRRLADPAGQVLGLCRPPGRGRAAATTAAGNAELHVPSAGQ